ncbi:unnamed protein product [Alternaria alternata]
MEVESGAARLMLDKKEEKLAQSPVDHNVYTLGSINGHNVVIASLPSTGNTSAATVITQLPDTFKQIRFGLLVGIGGGVPIQTDNGPIHLGDVVVSKPERDHSGAIQYDHGKALEGCFRRTGYLIPPPTVLLNAAQDLSTEQATREDDLVVPHLQRIKTSLPILQKYKYPGPDKDHLYKSDYLHRVEEGHHAVLVHAIRYRGSTVVRMRAWTRFTMTAALELLFIEERSRRARE